MNRNILIIAMVIILTLIIGCNEKKIVLNENTITEQIDNENRLLVREKEFEIENIDGVSFKPYYITEAGVYGINYVDTEFDNGVIIKVAKYSLRKISSLGVNEDTGVKVVDYDKLPFVVEERNNGEFVYKNYITGEEKIIIEGKSKEQYSEYKLYQNQSEVKYVIKNSPYAIVIKLVTEGDGTLTKNINFININTGEKYVKNIKLESDDRADETFKIWKDDYFYIGKEKVIYSISQETGVIKKLTLDKGEILEEEYDKISNSPQEDYKFYSIYSNEEETRIIYDEVNNKRVECQSTYKVSTKEHDKFYDTNNGKMNSLNLNKMLTNGLLFTVIKDEYVLAKFDNEGIKIVYKFDFSSDLDNIDEKIGEISIVSDAEGKEILVKLTITDNESKPIRDIFKMYEIKE